VINVLNNMMGLKAIPNSIEYVTRLGGGGGTGRRPLLVKFTTFGMKLQVLQITRKLAGFGVSVDKVFAPDIRKIR
jgi:hypothetical protein